MVHIWYGWVFFFSSRRRHTRWPRDWSSDVCSSDLTEEEAREQNFDITVKVQNYGDVAYGWAMEDNDGICKLIADKRSEERRVGKEWRRRWGRKEENKKQINIEIRKKENRNKINTDI